MKNLFRFCFIALLPAVSLNVAAQKIQASLTVLTDAPDNDHIIYDKQRRLTIEDFKGTPDAGSGAVAITTSGFMFKAGYHSANGKSVLNISVYCSFDKQTSWMKEKGKNAYILAHEQHHFDISYLGMLQFMKKVRHTKFKEDGYMQQLKDMYYETTTAMEQLQNQYDTETHNGILKDKQAEWEKKIDEELASLSSENS